MICKSVFRLIIATCPQFSIGLVSPGSFRMPWASYMFLEDMKFFRSVTLQNTVIMGSNTAYSIGRLLPNRNNFIFTKKTILELGGHTIRHIDAYSSQELSLLLQQTKLALLFSDWSSLDVVLPFLSPPSKVFVIGGRETILSALDENRLDSLYITIIDHQDEQKNQTIASPCASITLPFPEKQSNEELIYLPEVLQKIVQKSIAAESENIKLIRVIHRDERNLLSAKIYLISNLI